MKFRSALASIAILSLGSAAGAAETNSAWKNLMLGSAELDSARYVKADEYLTKAVAAQPKDAVALLQRGRCRSRLEKYDLAAADFKKALSLHPNKALTLQALKNLVAANQSLKKWRDCVEECDAILVINPHDAYAYGSRSRAYDQLGQKDKAKKDEAICRGLNPRTPAYWRATNLLRTDNANQGKLKDAQRVLNTHLEHFPYDADAYFERARVNSQLGKIKEALADYDRSIKECPERFQPNFERAMFLLSLKRYKEAIDALSASLLIGPGNEHLLLDRAACYTQLADYQNSIKDYSSLIDLHPDDEDPIHYRARVFVLTKQFDKALSDYNRTILLAPDQAANYRERSQVYEKLGKHDLAVKDEQKAKALLSGT